MTDKKEIQWMKRCKFSIPSKSTVLSDSIVNKGRFRRLFYVSARNPGVMSAVLGAHSPGANLATLFSSPRTNLLLFVTERGTLTIDSLVLYPVIPSKAHFTGLKRVIGQIRLFLPFFVSLSNRVQETVIVTHATQEININVMPSLICAIMIG